MHFLKKSTNCQTKLKSWFWSCFTPLYSYWTLKVNSGYSSLGYLIVSTCDMNKVLENLMFRYLHLPKTSTNRQSKLKSLFWDSFSPLYSYWILNVSSGYSSLGYIIVSTCDMIKLLENLMFGYIHLPPNNRNPQSKLKYWFWDSFQSLYLYWTLKVCSGYSSSGYLIVSTCDMRKVLENLMFGHLHLPKKSTNRQNKLKSWFWSSFPPLYSYWTLKVNSGSSSSGYLIVSTVTWEKCWCSEPWFT